MKKNILLTAIIAGLGLGLAACNNSNETESAEISAAEAEAARLAAIEALPPLDEQWNLIYDYCVGCHNETDYTGGLSLEYVAPDFVHEEGEIWETAIKKLATGQMPPVGEPKPSDEERQTFIASLEAVLDEEAMENPNPGAPVLPRMNRTEYQNAMRDLLNIPIDSTSLLAPDVSAEGFDNMAAALQVSATTLEGFVAASGRVASLAVGDMSMPPDFSVYRVPRDSSGDKRVEGAPIGTIGGIVFDHYAPLDGEYEFSPKLIRTIQDEARGIEFPHTLEITIDKERVHTADFGGFKDTEQHEFDSNSFALAEEIDERFRYRTFLEAGNHTVTVNFIAKPASPDAEIWRQHGRTSLDLDVLKGPPQLDNVEVRGPINPTGTGNTASREKIFICNPGTLEDEQLACANEILSNLANEAYRRPVTENEISDLLGFYEIGREIGGFEKGIETGIRRIISGPEFLFRAEEAPTGVAPGQVYEISDLELASRLSFFLWSTIPDEELRDLAVEGRLSDPDILDTQVERMLADPKAENLTENFAVQWLTLRNLNAIVPDPFLFPDYDDNLRQSSILETKMLFKSIVDEDKNVTDLINADYTYVNENLAEVYGIPGIVGSRMRRVEVPQEERRGILGHSSILTLTSLSIRTSPVTRGKYFLTNLVGTPPPEPPPGVDTNLEPAEGEPQTLREQMVQHRADPSCAACHVLMDSIGFAMESFDGVGRFRTRNLEGLTLDTADTLFDGSEIGGMNDLRGWLVENEEIFVQTMTEKLMQFALARPIEHTDMPYVREIVRNAERNDYRFSSLIHGIVDSVPFRMRINDAQEVAAN
ncbi:MAG: hypothetical protein CMP91_10500 [Gammaproteobacteria bacterium]|nr:hypothetical protein [Gammaproteobacteria bacterium]|tara:strand:- start:166411 stop:168873 length:2463 start_codon:yes stop_codon:yes gene_type:complete